MKNELDGLLLLGGESSRFGTDKMSVALDEAPLYHAAFRALAAVCGHINLSLARREQVLPEPPPVQGCTWSVVEDATPGQGPLGGIHSVLSSRAKDILVVAGDLPALKADSLRRIVNTAESSDAMLVAARMRQSGREQPLCGLWRGSIAEELGDWLASGRRSVFRFLEGREITWVDVEDAQLININRRGDLDLLT